MELLFELLETKVGSLPTDLFVVLSKEDQSLQMRTYLSSLSVSIPNEDRINPL